MFISLCLASNPDISITPTTTHDPRPTTQDCDNTDQLAFKYIILRFQFIILFLQPCVVLIVCLFLGFPRGFSKMSWNCCKNTVKHHLVSSQRNFDTHYNHSILRLMKYKFQFSIQNTACDSHEDNLAILSLVRRFLFPPFGGGTIVPWVVL